MQYSIETEQQYTHGCSTGVSQPGMGCEPTSTGRIIWAHRIEIRGR
uniref:Uncharacterized protein n=1 Tax=Arundo donax TaxID=35708 RepID=A0A0A9BLK0_ARUDO